MVDSVGLGSSGNSALQGLQRTSQKSNQTHERLSTEHRINDPLDGAEDLLRSSSIDEPGRRSGAGQGSGRSGHQYDPGRWCRARSD